MSQDDSSPYSQSTSGSITATALSKHSPGCKCEDSRLIAQQQAVRLSPEMVLRHAAITLPSDPGYMDLETIAYVLHSWHLAGLKSLVDRLWTVLESRTKRKIASDIQRMTYSSMTNSDQKEDVIMDVRLAMYKGIMSGTYLWKCHFIHALNMRIKTAVSDHLNKTHATKTTQVDDFDTVAGGTPSIQARLDFSMVETRNLLDNVYLSKLNDDQLLVVKLRYEGHSYECIAQRMQITLQECTALVKQVHEKVKRIEKAERNEGKR